MRDVLNVDPRAPSETKPTRRKRERERTIWILMSGIKVRDDKNDYALPHLIVAVKRYSLRWIWFSRVKFIATTTLTLIHFVSFFFLFLSFLSRRRKEENIKLENYVESAKRDDSIRNIGRGVNRKVWCHLWDTEVLQIYDILLYVIGGRYENSARQVYGFISGFMRSKKILIRFLRLGNQPSAFFAAWIVPRLRATIQPGRAPNNRKIW